MNPESTDMEKSRTQKAVYVSLPGVMRAKPQELVSGQRPPPLELGFTREASTRSRVMTRKKSRSSFGNPRPMMGPAARAANVLIPRETAISGHASRLGANRFIGGGHSRPRIARLQVLSVDLWRERGPNRAVAPH